jgi:hypothetical protein
MGHPRLGVPDICHIRRTAPFCAGGAERHWGERKKRTSSSGTSVWGKFSHNISSPFAGGGAVSGAISLGGWLAGGITRTILSASILAIRSTFLRRMFWTRGGAFFSWGGAIMPGTSGISKGPMLSTRSRNSKAIRSFPQAPGSPAT